MKIINRNKTLMFGKDIILKKEMRITFFVIFRNVIKDVLFIKYHIFPLLDIPFRMTTILCILLLTRDFFEVSYIDSVQYCFFLNVIGWYNHNFCWCLQVRWIISSFCSPLVPKRKRYDMTDKIFQSPLWILR
jgi:hypothetical protein